MAQEIRQLERLVSGYFDYIEDLVERENAFNMEQFAASVNELIDSDFDKAIRGIIDGK